MQNATKKLVPSNSSLKSVTDAFKDIFKFIPKTVQSQPQTLYAQGLHLRKFLNLYSQENTKLKTKLARLKKQNVRLTKSPVSSGPSVTNSLKMMILQGKQQNQKLREQIAQIKSTAKYVKNAQIQIQLVEANEEIKRLKRIIEQRSSYDHSLKDLKKRYQHQFAKNKELLIQNQALDAQRQDLIAKLKQQDQVFSLFKDRFSAAQSKLQFQVRKLKLQLKRQNQNSHALEGQILTLNKQVRSAQNDLGRLRRMQKVPQTQLQHRSVQLKMLRQQMSMSSQDSHRSPVLMKSQTAQGFKRHQQSEGDYNQQFEEEESEEIMKSRLEQLGQLCAFRLLSQNFSSDKLIALLQTNNVQTIGIQQLFQMFEQSPFSIADQEDIQKILNYFFETQELEEDMQISFLDFKAKLKSFIKVFQIDFDALQACYESLSSRMLSVKESVLGINENRQISRRQLQKLMRREKFREEQRLLLLALLSGSSESLQRFEKKKLIKLFSKTK